MRTISAEIDDATAAALDNLVRQEGRPRSQVVAVAAKTLLEFSPGARLAVFAIDGLATKDERAAAIALIGQSAIDAYQGMMVARQGLGDAEEEPEADIEAFPDL